MPRRNASSPEEDSTQASASPSPSPPTKRKNPAAVSEALVQRKRIATGKQIALDQDAAAANVKKIQDLTKKLAKAKKDAKTAKQLERDLHLNSDGDECESEERDPGTVPGFRTSITQLPSVKVASNRNQSTTLRRSNVHQERVDLANPTTHLSNRTFLKLPHNPISVTPEPISHPTTSLAVTPEPTNFASSSPSRYTSPSALGYVPDARSSPSSRHSSLPAPVSIPQSMKTLPAAELLEGVVASSRPKASDYIDVVNALLVRTMFDYEGLVSTHDAFPSPALPRQWALRCWKRASKDAEEFYDLSDRMCNLIKKRGSRIRGHVLAIVRPQIIATYNFSRKVTVQAKIRNRALCETLLDSGTFHYKDTSAHTGFCQNKILSEILYLAWFEDKTSQGPLLQHYFNPIPLETLALILTVIDFCLREWSTGTFSQAKFFEKDVFDTHKSYRLEVEAWNAVNSVVIANIRKKLFNWALRSAGVVDSTIVVPSCLLDTTKDRVQTELEGRTGETDSEVSNE